VIQLVLNYNTTLFFTLAPEKNFDGLVIACGRGFAGAAALLPSKTGTPTGLRAFVLLASMDWIGGALLFASAGSASIVVAYVLFVLFYGLTTFLFAMASAAVAAHVSSPARATLLFTANTFVSLAFQTGTQTLIGHWGLHLTPEGKFWVLGVQLAGLGILFALAALVAACGRLGTWAQSAWMGGGAQAAIEADIKADDDAAAAAAEAACSTSPPAKLDAEERFTVLYECDDNSTAETDDADSEHLRSSHADGSRAADSEGQL
jgi:hypothetical protein